MNFGLPRELQSYIFKYLIRGADYEYLKYLYHALNRQPTIANKIILNSLMEALQETIKPMIDFVKTLNKNDVIATSLKYMIWGHRITYLAVYEPDILGFNDDIITSHWSLKLQTQILEAYTNSYDLS